MCCIHFGHIIRMENKWKWKCHSDSFLFWLHLSKNSLEWLRKKDHQSNTIINKTTTCSKINTHSLSTMDTLTVFRFYLGCIFFSLSFSLFLYSHLKTIKTQHYRIIAIENCQCLPPQCTNTCAIFRMKTECVRVCMCVWMTKKNRQILFRMQFFFLSVWIRVLFLLARYQYFHFPFIRPCFSVRCHAMPCNTNSFNFTYYNWLVGFVLFFALLMVTVVHPVSSV